MDEHPLRIWRKANKRTLADLSTEVGVTPSHLSEIERGLNAPSLALAMRIARVAEIPVEKLARAEAAE
jgi:transcriptional regulator with XRE-family HTH domain